MWLRSRSISSGCVGREVVDRHDTGQAVVVADVVDMPLQVGQALLQRRQVSAPVQVLGVDAAMVLERAHRGHDTAAQSGRRPDLRHLMSMNFSAPRSAPKPASVTT
jgi:hypothetical protein